ncbi:hypothetical protein PV392_30280 [Streptomyces sp. ME03-5709C]|nr:hypothetical protein [Streptomyces sp. ME03-5709C]
MRGGAAPWDAGVPATGRQPRALPRGCSFAHHVRLVVGDRAATDEARATAARQATDTHRDRGHARFVTPRRRHVGRVEAPQRPGGRTVRTEAGFTAGPEELLVVRDDRPAPDAGHIHEAP